MFDWLFDLLGMMMSFFSSITGSYILALLMYALIFKIVFIPFGIKQQKNQIKMAGLAPKIQLIKAKYAGRNDQRSQQKQQEEIMDLQQKEGYNGCSGCLPLLIQLPIIMLLYSVIQSPLSYIATETDLVAEYNQKYDDADYSTDSDSFRAVYEVYGDEVYKKNEDGSFYKDSNGNNVLVKVDPITKLYTRYELAEDQKRNEIKLIDAIYKNCYEDDGVTIRQSEVDYIEKVGIRFDSIPNFRLFGVNLASTPDIMNPSIILIIPFLAAISSWLSMFLTKKMNGSSSMSGGAQDEATAKSMKIMDLIMPLMTLWIAFNFSGMLGLYWVFQSLLGLLQTFILSRTMPIPKFSEEDMREFRRQEKEIEKQARAAAKTTRHRSLHYIDEDDYDELPEAPQNESASKKSKSFGSDAPEIKD